MIRIVALAFACAVLCSCAQSYKWAPGPNAQLTDYNMQSSRCSYLARHGGGGYVAVGDPLQVGAAAVGHGLAERKRTQLDFNDCMMASGWVPAQ